MQSSHQFGGFFPQQQQQAIFQSQQQPQYQTPFGQQQQQQQMQVIVKAYVGDQTKRFRTTWPCSLSEMFKNLYKVFQTEIKSTVIQYCDEDNDWISIEKEEEWQELQYIVGLTSNKTLKLRVDNGQGLASKQLEQAIEKTLYQIDSFASTLQREGAQAANSKAVRAVYESIRNKLEELIAPEVWAEIFGSRTQPQQAKPKEQEFTVQVDLKSSNVNLLETPPKPVVVEQPKPVPATTPIVTPIQPIVPQPNTFPPSTFPTQPFVPQPTIGRPPLQPPFVFGQQPPPFGIQPSATVPFGYTPQQQQQPPQMGFGFQQVPQQQIPQQQIPQQPQQPQQKTPEQSWTFLEVNNQKPAPPVLPQQPTTAPATTSPVVTTTYTNELKQLQDMGLPPANLPQLLEKHKGNIAAVIQEVFAAQN